MQITSRFSRFFRLTAAGLLFGVVPRAFLGPFFGSPKPRLLVVLDLDETLLHASLCDSRAFGAFGVPAEALSWLPSRLWQPSVDFEAAGKGLVLGLGEELPLFVSLRPGAQGFLSWLKSNEDIEIAVYTAGTQAYAEQSVAKLGLQGFPALFRDECVPFGLPITKDLTKLGRDLSRVVLVDNSRRSFWLQPENGLLVSDWTGRNPDDKELERVRRELGELLALEDVRPTLSQRSEPSGTLPLLVVLALAAAAGALLSQVSLDAPLER